MHALMAYTGCEGNAGGNDPKWRVDAGDGSVHGMLVCTLAASWLVPLLHAKLQAFRHENESSTILFCMIEKYSTPIINVGSSKTIA